MQGGVRMILLPILAALALNPDVAQDLTDLYIHRRIKSFVRHPVYFFSDSL